MNNNVLQLKRNQNDMEASVRDYQTNAELIMHKGHVSPPLDKGDRRYREIWQYIIDHDLGVKIVSDIDYETDIYSSSSPYAAYFQIRENSENDDIVDDLMDQFYLEEKTMQRLPVGTYIDGKVHVSVGNHRVKSHVKGQKRFPTKQISRPIIIFDPENELSDLEKALHGLEIAAISNRKNEDHTEPETTFDVAKQLQRRIEVEERLVRVFQSEEDKREFAEEWLMKNKNVGSNFQGRVLNMLFSEDISHPIELQTDSEIDLEWQKFFGNNSFWNPELSKAPQKKYVSHFGNFKLTVINQWLKREKWSDKNKRIQAVVRVGKTMDAKITSEKGVQSGRSSYLKEVREWNSNINVIESGMPIITHILFVKQTDNGFSEAYEWNVQTEEFDKKELDS
jgi:hypothetical protein